MTSQHSDTDPSPKLLAGTLAIAVVRFARQLRGRNSAVDVPLSQLSALSTLNAEGDLAPGELARIERVQPPSMTRVVAALAYAGLVDRRPYPNDGRQIVVSITDKGRAKIAEESSARQAWLAERLLSLSEEERQALATSVAVFDEIVSDGQTRVRSA